MLEFRLNAHFIRNYNTIEEMSGEPRTATHPLMFMGFQRDPMTEKQRFTGRRIMIDIRALVSSCF